MKVIVFDLEWNQAVRGKKDTVKDIPFEIIEIGAVKLNKRKEIIDEFDELVKPVVYKELHFIIKKMIHIKPLELKNGKLFQDVVGAFLQWSGRNCTFATWGPLDLLELQRNMEFYHVKPIARKPFCFIDVQKLFSICYEDGHSRRTLAYAVEYLQIEKTKPFHRALSDAYYTAKVLEQIDNRIIKTYVSYDCYQRPKHKRDEIKHTYPTYSKYISREYKSRMDAMEDRDVNSTRCYLCHRKTEELLPWFSTNGKHYYQVGGCKQHGYIKHKMRIKKTDDNKVFIIKTSKRVPEDVFHELCARYQKDKEMIE
ncbi:MAG: 3'-5' exonuclease [Eubacteriales bacterium]